MNPRAESGWKRLERAARRLRGLAALSGVAWTGAAAAGAVSALAMVPAELRAGRGSPVPAVLASVVCAAAVWLAWRLRRDWLALTEHGIACEADAQAGLGSGDVRGAMELGRSRTAGEAEALLAAMHRHRVGEALSRSPAGPAEVSGAAWRGKARLALTTLGVLLVVLAGSGALRPEQTLAAARAFGTPWRTAFPPPLPAIEVEASDPPRGRPAWVTVRAPGRDSVVLNWAVDGEATGSAWLALGADGSGSGATRPVERLMTVWVEDRGGVTSDTLTLRPAEPLLVEDLRVGVSPPTYLGLPDEIYRGLIPPLAIAEGSTVSIRGVANLRVDRAELVRDGSPGPGFSVDGTEFSAAWIPDGSGEWTWRLVSSESRGDPVLPPPLRIATTRDHAPRIELIYPDPEALFQTGWTMPVVVGTEDDLGITRALVTSWRQAAIELAGPLTEVLTPDPSGARRAIFRHVLGRSGEEFLPGDTLNYQFTVYDAHPTRGPALSPVYVVRVPELSEIRQARAEAVDGMASVADSSAQELEELGNTAADASRITEGDTSDDFGATEDARRAEEEAFHALEQMAELERRIEEMREALRNSALGDPMLEEQLERFAEWYAEMAESGLAPSIDGLGAALESLDPDALARALDELAAQADELATRMQQARGMLEQMALEQSMKAAQAEAADLASEQEQLAARQGGETFQHEQQEVLDRTAEFAGQLSELEEELERLGRQEAVDSVSSARRSAETARHAMEQALGGERSEAAAQMAVQEAAGAMQEASHALGGSMDSERTESEEDVQETLALARTEALALADEQSRLSEAARTAAGTASEWRNRQAAIRQGLEGAMDRLSSSGSGASLVRPQTSAAGGEALRRMDRILSRMGGESPPRFPARAESDGVAHALLDLSEYLLAEEAAAAAAQQSAGQAAAEQMSRLAQQQQQVMEGTSAMMIPGQPRAPRMRQQLAEAQQQIADELGQLEDPDQELAGQPEELAWEAEDLANRLGNQGPDTETVKRQRQLFRRMLDAGRSLEGEEVDEKRRESEAATAEAAAPEEIDPDLLAGGFPAPQESQLRAVPAFYRVLVLDYFDRMARLAPPDG